LPSPPHWPSACPATPAGGTVSPSRGLLYFEPFRQQAATGRVIHLIEGAITGDGRWKVGDCVTTLMRCHGSGPESATQWAGWQEYRQIHPHHDRADNEVRTTARRYGADT
jgi:hypothetical protein